VVLITGAAGDIGTSLMRALHKRYTPVGLDLQDKADGKSIFAIDLTSDQSVQDALARLRERHGSRLAAVVHLAAYFDFTGKEHPMYRTVNVDGSRRLLHALRGFDVGNFIYASTMLVHAPAKPGQRIDESAPLAPAWAYPQSKADAEAVIQSEHGDLPYTLLRFAGLYDDRSCIPTLAQQIARIYERDLQSHLSKEISPHINGILEMDTWETDKIRPILTNTPVSMWFV
jgi:nucleoside-diphosphate-sugar epimerase